MRIYGSFVSWILYLWQVCDFVRLFPSDKLVFQINLTVKIKMLKVFKITNIQWINICSKSAIIRSDFSLMLFWLTDNYLVWLMLYFVLWKNSGPYFRVSIINFEYVLSVSGHWRCFGIFSVNLEDISHLFLVFLLLTFIVDYCWLCHDCWLKFTRDFIKCFLNNELIAQDFNITRFVPKA